MKSWRWLDKKAKAERDETIIKLKEQGLMNKQIGQHVGLTGDRVKQILKEKGYSHQNT